MSPTQVFNYNFGLGEFKHPLCQNHTRLPILHTKFPWIFFLGSLAQSNTTTTLATNPTTTLTNTTLPPTNTTLSPTTTAEPCYDSFTLEKCQDIMAAGIYINLGFVKYLYNCIILIQ